jgi:predicted TIM-barrel fold metal-dependent hydrolase
MSMEQADQDQAPPRIPFPIVDTDTHIVEPADLWTSRVSRRFVDAMPKVETDEEGLPRWRMGHGRWLTPLARYACAGTKSYPPYKPHRFEEVEPASYDMAERIKWMDREGIYASVMYPNIVAFETHCFWEMEPETSFEAVRAYNDFLVDVASEAPGRLIPVAMMPFWDLEASVAELRRAHTKGHRGILWANKFELIDQPSFVDPYWDPVYQEADELGMSVNLHVGFATKTGNTDFRNAAWAATYDPRVEVAQLAPSPMNSNGMALAKFTTSRLPQRFPQLKFVSVEAGAGYVPYLMDSLDWFWHAYGAYQDPTVDHKPSDIFARQCYVAYSYETSTLPLFETMADNVMFSTDFPHDQSVFAGPCSPALGARRHVDTYYHALRPETAQKALGGNAARVYDIDLPEKWPW